MTQEPGITAPLPLSKPRAPRTVLTFAQIMTAAEWMKSKPDEVRDMTDATLAAHLTVVLGREVTTSNVSSLREGAGLPQREPADPVQAHLRTLSRAVEFLLATSRMHVPLELVPQIHALENEVEALQKALG